MKNACFILIVLVIGLVSCKTDPPLPPTPPQPVCPFKSATYTEKKERTEQSAAMANKLTLALGKIPKAVPITAKDVLTFSLAYNKVIEEFTNKPIDVYLTGTMNTYLEVTVCNTYIMLALATEGEKPYYQGLLREQFLKLTHWTETYSSGVDPEPLPGCAPPPKRGDTATEAAIEAYFVEKIAGANGATGKQRWITRRDEARAFIRDCKRGSDPSDCLRGRLQQIQALYADR